MACSAVTHALARLALLSRKWTASRNALLTLIGMATVVFDDQKLEPKDIVEGLRTNTAYKVTEFKEDQNKKEPEQI